MSLQQPRSIAKKPGPLSGAAKGAVQGLVISTIIVTLLVVPDPFGSSRIGDKDYIIGCAMWLAVGWFYGFLVGGVYGAIGQAASWLLRRHSLDQNQDDSLMDELIAANPMFQAPGSQSEAISSQPLPSEGQD